MSLLKKLLESELGKKLLGPALGLALSASTMNCMETPGYDDVFYVQNSIFGTYDGKFQITNDPDNLYGKETGEVEMKIYTLGHDARIRFGIFYTRGSQDYDRHPITGEIDESWEALDVMYPLIPLNYKVHLIGNITTEQVNEDGQIQPPQLNITIDAEFENTEDRTATSATIDVWGYKVSDELD